MQSSWKRQIRCIFTPTLDFVRIYFPAWNSNLHQKNSAHASHNSGILNLASTTKDQKIAPNRLLDAPGFVINCPVVDNTFLTAVGLTSCSSLPIQTSNSNCVFNDMTIITPMLI